jgi:hypothetical protein
VGGIVGLVHRLGLAAIAEGVERDSEAVQLDALDVEHQQGFLPSAPCRAPTSRRPGPRYGVSTTFRQSSFLCLNVSYIFGASDNDARCVMMKLGSIWPSTMRSSRACW